MRPVFTTIHSYLPNLTAAWFLVTTVGAIKGAITNIADDNPDKGTTPEAEQPCRQESRSSGFRNRLLDEVSKGTQQQPGLCLRAAAGTGLLPAIPPRQQYHPPPYGKFPETNGDARRYEGQPEEWT